MDEGITATIPPTVEQVAALTTQIPQMPLMYYNYARTAVSFYDLRVFFGHGSVSPQGQPTFQEQLCLVFSLEFAKTLRDQLSSTLAAYEEKFGSLRHEPKFAAASQTAPETNGRKKKKKN
jgi:hypothetical protein